MALWVIFFRNNRFPPYFARKLPQDGEDAGKSGCLTGSDGVRPPGRGAGRARVAPGSALREIAQHVVQHAAVAHVIDLHFRIDPAAKGDLAAGAIGVFNGAGHL